jgi:hypothetical protein
LLGLLAYPAAAQLYVTGLTGAAALSPDAAAQAQPLASSNYDPKIGLAANLGVGVHRNDWFSFQLNYIWNRNRIVQTEIARDTFSQRENETAQHAVTADLLVYFRPRSSRIRPYLSAGPGYVRLLGRNEPGLRVAVGMDVTLRAGWGLRYSFSETMSANPFSESLQPPGVHILMNFQNLFGLVKRF